MCAEKTEVRYTYEYRCKVTGADGTELFTDVVKITEPVALEIVTQPVDYKASVGETATFTVEATGVASYQWQWKAATGTVWRSTTADGNKTATMSVETTEVRYSYEYRCKLTGVNGKELYTDVVKIEKAAIVIDEVTYEPIDAESCRVVSYSGSASSLTIPETVEGMTVTEIGVEAFMGNATLESIDLPDTIVAIRARAFKNCSNLRDMH